MANGYPQGAFVLARSIFEGAVVLNYLYENCNDADMLKRFFDDIELSALQIAKETNTFLDNEIVEADKKRLNKFVEKYADFCDKRGYSNYWWAKKGWRFSQTTETTNIRKKLRL